MLNCPLGEDLRIITVCLLSEDYVPDVSPLNLAAFLRGCDVDGLGNMIKATQSESRD